MIELPSLIGLVSLKSLFFYVPFECVFTEEEGFRPFSRINNILPANIKEIRFGLRTDVMKAELRDGWKGIDDTLCDPRLQNLQLLGLHERFRGNVKDLESHFREWMPKSHRRGILWLENDDQ